MFKSLFGIDIETTEFLQFLMEKHRIEYLILKKVRKDQEEKEKADVPFDLDKLVQTAQENLQDSIEASYHKHRFTLIQRSGLPNYMQELQTQEFQTVEFFESYCRCINLPYRPMLVTYDNNVNCTVGYSDHLSKRIDNLDKQLDECRIILNKMKLKNKIPLKAKLNKLINNMLKI